MADETGDTVIEHVLYIRGALERLDSKVEDLGTRLDSINETMDRIKQMLDRCLAQFGRIPSH